VKHNSVISVFFAALCALACAIALSCTTVKPGESTEPSDPGAPGVPAESPEPDDVGQVQQALTTIGGPCNTNGTCSGEQTCIEVQGVDYCSVECTDMQPCIGWPTHTAPTQMVCHNIGEASRYCVYSYHAECESSQNCDIHAYCEDLDGDGEEDHCSPASSLATELCYGAKNMSQPTCDSWYNKCCARQDEGHVGETYCDHPTGLPQVWCDEHAGTDYWLP
jgi:hypothetical protein